MCWISESGDSAVRLHGLGQGSVVLKVWAPWCSACRALGPIVDDAAATSGVRVHAVQADADTALAGQFGVRSIPTLIALCDGIEVARVVGLQSRDAVDSVFAAASGVTESIRAQVPRALVALRAAVGGVLVGAGLLLGSPILGIVGAAVAAWAAVGFVRN